MGDTDSASKSRAGMPRPDRLTKQPDAVVSGYASRGHWRYDDCRCQATSFVTLAPIW
jgi:hypothetical protein